MKKNKDKNRTGGTSHKPRSKGRIALAGIFAALVLLVCAGMAVITPAVAASNTTNTGGFSMANILSSIRMFYGCSEIEGQNGTTYNDNITDAEYANIDTDDEAGYLSTADICAFAVYSTDDGSLTFYNQNIEMAVVGEKFRGKTVTAVYTGFDTATYTYTSCAPWYSIAEDVISVSFADEIAPVSTAYWFYGFTSCTSIEMDNLDTSGVTDMSYMFCSCESLTGLDFTGWDTSNVTSMMQMFYGCASLTSLDVSMFDTSNVTNIYHMFMRCYSLTTLDVSMFDTSNVEVMQGLFYYCTSLTTVNVTGFDFSSLFDGEYTLPNDSVLETASSLTNVFRECNSLTTIIGLDSWDTSSVKYMRYVFYNCTSLTSIDLSSWNTSSAEKISGMFTSCTSLTSIDLSGWDTSSVEEMPNMFNGCSELTTVYVDSNWSTASVTESGKMFYECTSIKGASGTTYSSNYIDCTYARIDRPNFGQPGYFTSK